MFFNTLIVYMLVICGAAKFQSMGRGPLAQFKGNTEFTLCFEAWLLRVRWISS